MHITLDTYILAKLNLISLPGYIVPVLKVALRSIRTGHMTANKG